MKILHTVEFYYPSTGGSQEVVRQLSERMAKLGHDVTVATSWLPERKKVVVNGVKIKQFRIIGNEVRGYEGDTSAYTDFLMNEKFDVIMNYAAQQWASDLFFDVMDKIKARKIFVPCGFSALFDPAYKTYFEKMPAVLKKYDKTVYLSPTYRDFMFAKQHGVSNMVVIPNGADEKEFQRESSHDIRSLLSVPKNYRIIMHLGSFTGQKGQPEAISIYKRADIADSVLVCIGNVFDKEVYQSCLNNARVFNALSILQLKHQRIYVRSLPRDKTIDLLKEADVFLFPSNIEASPLVLFEACAAKTPFLTTDVGNAREIIGWTGGGMLLPTNKDEIGLSHADILESADMLARLCADDKLRSRLAKAGYSNWSNSYSWAKIFKSYVKLYTESNLM